MKNRTRATKADRALVSDAVMAVLNHSVADADTLRQRMTESERTMFQGQTDALLAHAQRRQEVFRTLRRAMPLRERLMLGRHVRYLNRSIHDPFFVASTF